MPGTGSCISLWVSLMIRLGRLVIFAVLSGTFPHRHNHKEHKSKGESSLVEVNQAIIAW